jgi:peptidoglycan biosynthesis protein MviN/MurJ (putative lipid II flippase)
MVLLNLALNLTLVWPFREAGIAAATAISGLGSFLILNRFLRKRFPDIRFGPAIRTFALSTLAAGMMGAAAWSLHRWVLIPLFPGTTILRESARLLIPIGFAAAFYYGITRLFGMGEAREILRRNA